MIMFVSFGEKILKIDWGKYGHFLVGIASGESWSNCFTRDVARNLDSFPCQWLLSLKFSESAVTTLFGREFHTSTTLFENNWLSLWVLNIIWKTSDYFLLLIYSVYTDMVKKNCLSQFDPFGLEFYKLLWHLLLIVDTLGLVWSFSAFNLFSYVRPDNELTRCVALLWTFSDIILFFLNICDQTGVAYFRFCLISVRTW